MPVINSTESRVFCLKKNNKKAKYDIFSEVLESLSPIMGAKVKLKDNEEKNVSAYVTYFSAGLIMFVLLNT